MLVSNAQDYDDTNPLITDVLPRTFYFDGDEDGYGIDSDTVFQSYAPSGYADLDGDCDDTNTAIHPNNVWFAMCGTTR